MLRSNFQRRAIYVFAKVVQGLVHLILCRVKLAKVPVKLSFAKRSKRLQFVVCLCFFSIPRILRDEPHTNSHNVWC